MTISPSNVDHLDKVYSNVRQKLGRQPKDDMLEIDRIIWRIFMMLASMKAAVHLGQHYQENLRTTKNTDIQRKLIRDQNQKQTEYLRLVGWQLDDVPVLHGASTVQRVVHVEFRMLQQLG